MIKEVFNSITNGAGAAKIPAAGSNLEKQTGESQGFFGKMFTALQQEDQQGQDNAMHSSGGKQEEGKTREPESKEGREAVKQVLLNLMNGGKTTSSNSSESELINPGNAKVEEAPENLEEQSPIRLVVKTTDQSANTVKTEKVSADSGIEKEETPTTPIPSESRVVKLAGSEQGVQSNAVHSEVINENAAQPIVIKPEVVSEKAAQPIVTNPEAVSEKAAIVTNERVKTAGSNVYTQQPAKNAETKENVAAKITVNPEAGPENPMSGKGNSTAPITDNLKAGEAPALQAELQSQEVESTKENVNRLKILNRETATTSEKPVKEPQKQAAFASGTNQLSSNETASRNERSSQPFQQMSQQQISKNELSSQLHVHSEMKAQHGNEERAKRYDFASQNSEGKAINGERLEAVAGSGTSSGNQQGASFSDTPNWLRFQASNQQNSGELNNSQQAFLDEHLKEVTENGDEITTDKTQNGMHRLGEIPVQNGLIRKSVLPGLTSIMQKATASGKEVPQSWQKHSFDLDDGNKIELSTRNSDGVIQLKIASSNHELTKLLQQYGQEIREHLEKECELNIDLQFSENQDEGLSEFFNNSSSSGKGKSTGMIGSANTAGESPKAQKPLQETVRRFGYNQMEWTA